MAIILDSLFHGLVNTTSNSMEVEGGVVIGNQDVVGSSDFKNLTLSSGLN